MQNRSAVILCSLSLTTLTVLMPRDAAQAASFTPGNLVVYRVGDGVATLVNTGNAVFLDEYTPGGTLLQSIALPTTASGSNNQLIASGTAASEGLLTRSVNGQYLLLTGYARNLGGSTSLSGTSAASVPRTVARVKFDASIDTSTALGDFASANNPRSAASTDGLDIWVGGAAGGVRYTRYSAFGSTISTQLSTASTNIEQVNIFNGQLYTSTQKGTLRVATLGSGTPTSGGQTITNLPGFPTTGNPDAFYFADLDGSPGLDTLYVADETAGLIEKYALVSGDWTAKGTITAASVHGLTGVVSGTTVTLYASGTTGADGVLYTFTDTTGYNATVSGMASTLVTAATNKAFRGVALAPVSPSSPTQTPTATATATAVPTTSNTPSPTPTATKTPTQTPTLTNAPTQVPTVTTTPTQVPNTGTATVAANTATPTSTATSVPTASSVSTPIGSSFTPGDIVVYRIGDGSTTLTNNGNAVFLDEYTPSGGLVQSVALPTTASGLQYPLIASADVSEGLLARSTDGQYVLLTGYATTLGGSTALATTTAATVPRTVGRVKYDGTIDTSTGLTDISSANNVRSATSTDGIDLWVGGASGGSGGVHYTTLGSTTSTQLFTTIPKGVRQANIFGGQLYFDSNAAGLLNVSAVGVGTPTTGGQTGTELPGLSDIAGNDGYVFMDLGDGHGLATLYVANDTLGEILKYSLVSGSWTASGTITAAGVHGVTGVVSGSDVTLYATGTTGTDGTLYSFTDSTGYDGTVSGTATTLVTAPSDQAFRGVALVPVGPAQSQTATATSTPTPTGTGNTPTPTGAGNTPTRSAIVSTATATVTQTATASATPAVTLIATPTLVPFIPGDIVVYRVGDGSTALTNNGNAVFLDEYTASGALVQSVALPTTASGSQNQLIASADVSEGLLARSTDGQYVLLTGYASNLGGSTGLATTTAATVPRTVGRVEYDGTIDTSTGLTDISSANNVRSATSTNGTDIWVGGASGSSGGVHYTTFGSSTSTQLFTTIPKGVRQANIFGGQLYFDSNATGLLNVSAVGVGTPTTGGQTGAELPGLSDIAGNDGYVFMDLGDGHGLATLYVANDTLGEILKYALVSGSWTASGTITAAGVHGVTGVVSGSDVTLYATGTTGTDGTLYSFTDTTGYDGTVSGTATSLTTASANEAFRGVALVPVAPALPSQTPTITETPAQEPTVTETPTQPPTATNTPTRTPTITESPTQAPTGTDTPTQTPTSTTLATATASASPTPMPTSTMTPTQLPTDVPTETPTSTPTATGMSTSTPSGTPSQTPTATVTAPACMGDCEGTHTVDVSDILTLVNIALGNETNASCPNGMLPASVTVAEILQAVDNALNGCPTS